MYHTFHQLDSTRHILPKFSNLINQSYFNDLTASLTLRSFVIKYVVHGQEHYKVNGTNYHLRTGEYLLTNHHSQMHVNIDCDTLVRGLCIDISPELIHQALSSMMHQDGQHSYDEIHAFFDSSSLPERHFGLSHARTGSLLNHLSQRLDEISHTEQSVSNEIYYELAGRMVADYSETIGQYFKIPSQKADTKRSLFLKLERARKRMRSSLDTPLMMRDVAMEAGMSEFHFYRLFKSVYSITPARYHFEARMQQAFRLLQEKPHHISDIAWQLGFEDLSSFSRNFRKTFGATPSQISKQKSVEY